MAANEKEIHDDAESEVHDANSYFEAFAGIVAALDALAKAVTPDADDDGTPPDEMPPPRCNSYFASFKAIQDALERVKNAVEERNALPGAGLFDLVAPPVTGGTVAIVDRAVNAVSLMGGTLVLSPPASIEGKARSFVVRLTMAAETDWSFPSGVNFESDDEGVFGDIETGATATFFFTEVSENRFLVARQDAATVTKG